MRILDNLDYDQKVLALEALHMYCFWGREDDDYEA